MQDDRLVDDLFSFIKKSPTAFHAVRNFEEMAEENGFIALDESSRFTLERGRSYYVKRDGASIIAFRIPKKKFSSFSIIAAHTDSPTFAIKRNPEISNTPFYTTLNTEGYGGMIISSWFDRPLSIAGRVFYSDGGVLKSRLVDFGRDLVLIPSLAIHMNREINKGYEYHVQRDVRPLYSLAEGSKGFSSLLSDASEIAKDSILDWDLYLYNRMAPSLWGERNEFISSTRLDDMECAYLAFRSLIESDDTQSLSMVALFDNEEVGSSSIRGALSDFLSNIIERISFSLGLDREDEMRMYPSSFVLSADNAHAMHPNYPEKGDVTNNVVLNGGVVIKYSANQKYTTSSYTASYVRLLMEGNGIRNQTFFNNSDIPGGSTLGNLSAQKISIPTADIGLAQLAMHSSYESAGRDDVAELLKLFKVFLSRT